MSIRAWRSLLVYLFFLLVFLLWFFSPAGALADEGSSSGPRVVVVGGSSGPDGGIPAGTDAGDAVEGETGEAPLPDPVEGPGETEDPGPAGEEDPEAPPEASPGEKDREALAGLPSPEDVSGSGASVYRLPLAVPPGRNGMDPDLYLTYHSRRGNGPAGVGWGLDLGSIRRSTKRGVDYGARDFVVEGGGDYVELVPREGDRGPGYYGAKIEEAFVKYRYNAATGGWTAFGKDGRVSYYGSTASSRQSGLKGVFRWCLDGVEDSNGNGMTVSYLKDGGQVYPEVLSYPGGSGTVTVRFSWEGRPDVLVRYDAGFPVASGKRLKAVAVSTGGALVRRYVLEYGPGSPSRLSALRAYGADGVTSLPAVGFMYQAGGTGDYGPAVSGVTGLVSAGPEVHFVEVNGDGKADLLVLEREVR
ncbi:MAG TPA: SpvB/TcaC N-terminal domain-containing protein, partial [Syntrophales bacterium]|nr:SpvB/TcaC N-terminal domain-containing protein [Syntrophales bacterium]